MRKIKIRENLVQRTTTVYSGMNTSFLRELAENINLSFRSHADTDKETLVRLLDKKISSEKSELVYKMYLTCFDAKDVAHIIKPKGMDEIVEKVKTLFKTSECLYEVTVGSNRCDLVFLSEREIIAVEVKSAQDKMKNAVDQLNSYSQWANQIFLAYDIKHRPTLAKLDLSNKKFGLIEFNHGTTTVTHESLSEEKAIDSVLTLMTYGYLGKIARDNKLSSTGRKQDIAARLVLNLRQKSVTKFLEIT